MAEAARVSNLNLANAFTMLRVALVPVFVWLLIWRVPTLPLVAAVVFLLAAATDTLDGYVARRLNLVTSFGEFLDPTADKLLVLAALAALVGGGHMPWWPVAIIASREVSVELLRVVLAGRGRSLPAAPLGKAKKVGQDIAVLVAIPAPRPNVVTYVALGAALVLTVASGAQYFIDAARGRAGVPWR